MDGQTIGTIIASLVGGGIITSLVIFAIIFAFRDAIASAIRDRLQKLDYARGETKFTVDLASPQIGTKQEPGTQGQVAADQPSIGKDDQHSATAQLPEIKPKDQTEWEKELFKQIFSDTFDLEKAEEAFTYVQAAEMNPAQRVRNEAIYLLARFKNGDAAALRKLETLAYDSRGIPDCTNSAYLWLGTAYEIAESLPKALEAFNTAAEVACIEDERIAAIRSVVSILTRLGRQDEALKVLTHAIAETSDSEALASLYEQLGEYFDDLGEQELKALALERALAHQPQNTKIRFQAARAYDLSNFDGLSLLHYGTLLRISPRDDAALNNIALQYESLGMPIKAVEMFRKSIDLGETLASANLARRYLDSGFVDEAVRLLDDAKKKDDVNPNVGSTEAAVSEKQKDEDRKRKEVLKSAREQQQFFLEYSHIYFSESTAMVSFSGVWRTDEGFLILLVQDENNVVLGKWVVNNKEHEFKSEVHGMTLRDIRISWHYSSSSLAFSLPETLASRGYAYMSPDGQHITMLVFKETETVQMRLRKVEDLPSATQPTA